MFKGKNKISAEFFRQHSVEDPITLCWDWRGYIQSGGYGQFRINNKGVLAHRASWAFYNQSIIPDELLVCHHCDNPKCINPKHLFLGTALDNAHDSISKGRNAKSFCAGHLHGRKNRKRKLTDQQVREIRATLHNGERLKDIAKRYDVTLSAISTIRRGKRKLLVT